MEHRWGTRRELDVTIRLDAGPRLIGFARLLNASSSGAYLATRAAPPLMTRVYVDLEWNDFRRDDRSRIRAHARIPAYVVRADERGVGLEWCDFAPLPILALIGRAAASAVDRAWMAPLATPQSRRAVADWPRTASERPQHATDTERPRAISEQASPG